MEEAKVKAVELTKQEAESILRAVILDFSDNQKSNLAANIKAGKTLNCGKLAYKFAGPDSGDLITLSISTELPVHVLDLNRIQVLTRQANEIYQEIISKHTLRYYFATQKLEEQPFKDLILDCIGGTS